MSFNGSGTFVINSAGQPVVANTVISATVFNALTADLATGLSTTITKDGQTTITANIPFGSNKITGLGSGTAATDAANLGQVQSTAAKLITVTGTDTITGTMSPALTAYAAGQLFYFIANGANTGAMTINVDGLGAKAITRDGATALIAGDVQSGEIIVICYDGTRFQMINAANSFGNTTINGTLTVTGNTALQANVSITSTLSVGGTFAVTGAATLGSTLAVTGKSDLPTVSTASINAAVAVITTGTVTALTATGASIASANVGTAVITTGTVTSLTATGASVASANLGTAVITTGTVTGLTVTGASIASMNAGVALLTTATVTTLTATGASIASANIGNLQFTAASIASINAGVAVITSLTATGASIASMNAGVALLTTATVTNLTATGASIASANAGNLQVTGASVASANFGNVVTTTERVTNFSATSASIASANAAVALITTGTVTNLTSTSASIASANIGNLLATSLTVSSGSTLNGGVVINEPGADVDFRVEGDTDANLLFVDASTDRIGIGTNTPATKLDVNGTIYAAAVYAQTIASVSSFSWNTATSSPAASSTNPYGGGAPVVTNIHRNMRRCLLADDGTVNYYLDESDSTLKADGSAAVLTGADGMVMVEIPAFYVKREVSGSVITWSVSDVPLSGFDLHPAFYKDGKDVKYRYYSAYDACVNTTGSTYQSGLNWDNNVGAGNGQAWNTATAKLASVSGIYPAVGITRADARAMAANRGTGWRQLDYTLLAAVQLLYLIEYQTFYSQNNTGGGNTATTYAASSGTQADNGASEAGKSNSIGNASTNTTNGASSASRQVAWMSYRGIENFYGNAWNWADGVIVNAAGSVSADSATWHFTNNSADFSDTVSTNMTLITSSGQTNFDYPDALASVNNFFISTSGGGSSTTYTTDYWYGSTSADRVVLVSGGADLGADAGAFFVYAVYDASLRGRAVGARLAF